VVVVVEGAAVLVEVEVVDAAVLELLVVLGRVEVVLEVRVCEGVVGGVRETVRVVCAEVALVVALDEPPPQPAASAARARMAAIAPAARVTVAPDGCHSQSARATDMVRRDGSESDGP
jgi:hypothetical protein